jgi:hypothetical protein
VMRVGLDVITFQAPHQLERLVDVSVV